MLAAVLREYGDPTALVVEEQPDPVAGPGQVVVDVAAAAINFPDVLLMANRYQVSVPLPFVPGSELAGTVRAVGAGVEDVAPGDRVCATLMVGAFAEQVAVPAVSLVPVPPEVDLVSAAALRVTYLTAYHSLVSVAGVLPGEWVAVLGGSGGVGSATLDVARHLECRTVAVVSTPQRAATCLARGADAALTYTDGDLKLRLREVSGDGLDVVIDPVGGAHAEATLRAMRWGGRYVTVGYASGQIPSFPLNLVLLKGVSIKGFEMRTFAEHAPEASQAGDAALMAMVAGGLRPHVSAVFPLVRAAEALLAVAERRTTGKVVLTTGAG